MLVRLLFPEIFTLTLWNLNRYQIKKAGLRYILTVYQGVV